MERVLELSKVGDEHILLMHANAYTPGCYRSMCTTLQKNYRITAPYQRQLWKNSDHKSFTSWSLLADDVITYLGSKVEGPVIGVGHSMGSIALWIAAIKRPDLFTKLVLIEPVVLPKKIVFFSQMTPYWLKEKVLPIVKIASKRTDRWPSKDALQDYLQSKKVFQRFDPKVLEDFVEDSFVEEENTIRLKYPRAWEARIYATAPNLWKRMSETPCPMMIIRAEYSDVLYQDTWDRIKSKMSNSKVTLLELKGLGHLAPFESPEEVGLAILDYLNQEPPLS